MADLKVQVEKEFEIPVDVQKWILGKQLVGEDVTTLESQGITHDGAEIYLYLVNPGEKKEEEDKVAAPVPAPQKRALVLPTEPNQKGRYWNYEMDRWSFCNSDDDDDRAEEVKQITNEVAAADNKDDEDEWEYYYDDVEVKPKEPVDDNQQQPAAAAPPQQQQQVPQQQVAKKIDGWECPVCTLVNPLERPGCQACTTERPADIGAAAAAAPAEVAAPEVPAATTQAVKPKNNQLDAYKQLENMDIIPNAENFECTICYLDVEPGDGVVLRECLHTFCKYGLQYRYYRCRNI